MLAQLGGNASPATADVKKILEAAGVSVDDGHLATFHGKVAGKDTEALITEGGEKLQSFGGGGGGGGGGGAAPAAGGGDAAPAAAAVEEKEESEEEDMGFGLFD
jgi:ribosomal protein L12E/L44/L45/RPP1/RPP2